MDFYDSIPGYKEAIREERAARDMSMLSRLVPLCGLMVRQFTPRHWLLLTNAGNAFTKEGTTILPEDIAYFLWVVSTEYNNEQASLNSFVEKIASLPYMESVTEINEYIEVAFQDVLPSVANGLGSKNYTSTCASLVDLLACEYGWDDESILEKPIARILQYQRQIRLRRNPRAPLFNRSETVIRDALSGEPRNGGSKTCQRAE